MAFDHLFMIFMAVLNFNTAFICNAEHAVSVQTGSSVQLDIQTDKPQFDTLVWMNEKSENIVVVFGKDVMILKDNSSLNFNEETFSLTLKNMQKTDSGFYTAKIISPNNVEVAKYRVSVIDPVDPPVLNWTATAISVHSCVVNVTCVGDILTLITSFHGNNCSQEEVTSTDMQSLTLRCTENTVICNYSNPVSWKNETIEINQLCTTHENESGEENDSSFPLLWIMVIVVSASLMILVAAAVLYCSCKNRNKGAQEENDQTIYEQVQMAPQPKNETQRPLEMLEKSANLQTVYAFMGEHEQTCNNSPEIPAQMQTNIPLCSVYSTIGQHQKSSPATETGCTVYSKVCKTPCVH